MSEYYHQFLSSMSGIGMNPNLNPQEAPPPTQQQLSMPLGAGPISHPYQSLGYYTAFAEPVTFSGPKSQRARRKSAPGLDNVKHRRTRSGCYTCRSRRVKCDETHPICERCRKGKRECIYPEPPPPKQAGSQGSRDASTPSQHASPESSHGDVEDDEEMERDLKLETIPDDEDAEPEAQPSQASRYMPPLRRSSTTSLLNLQRAAAGPRRNSETPSLEGTKSSSPSTSTGTAASFTPAAYQFSEPSLVTGNVANEWPHLSEDLRFYLNYFCENITQYHYSMVTDSGDFFQRVLPSIAVRSEPLLHAVVGFAAYHCTLRKSDGKMEEFLQYYNKSVTLLISFLQRKEKHNLGTLLTILQLATIEEYLGDWVNLMGHQKAALEVLTQLFTPQSAMQTPTGRMILKWYARYDVFVGLMGGFETALPHDWFSTVVDYCQAQVARDPSDVRWKIEECSARLRIISREMSILYGKRAKGELSGDDFSSEHGRIFEDLRNWKETLDPALADSAYLVTDFSYQRPLDEGDIVNPFQPGVLYDYPLFRMTILTCEWHSIVIMHAYQAAAPLPPDEQPPAELREHSYAICRIFETLELWPSSAPGCLILIQACLAIATLFLPRDSRHHMWIRRKFALLEAMGYIFPITMRTRMAELFRDQSCVHWWLPNDEGFSPILQSVRAFADERNATAVSAQTGNLREVRHVFAKMQLGGGDDGSQTGESDHGRDVTG